MKFELFQIQENFSLQTYLFINKSFQYSKNQLERYLINRIFKMEIILINIKIY